MKKQIELLMTKALQGPNFWSVEHSKIIVMKIRVAEIMPEEEKRLSDHVALKFPGLAGRHVEASTSMNTAQLIKHIALELQSLAGMPCDFGRMKIARDQQECYVAFQYQVEQAGLHAGQAAIKIVNALLYEAAYDWETNLEQLKAIKKKYGLGATTGYILDEVKKRNIPIRKMDAGSLVTLGYGMHQKKLRTAVADTTSGLGIELAGDKEETKNILAQANIPVPQGIIVHNEAELRSRIGEVKFPIVVKPLSGNQGRGVTTHIYDIDRAVFGLTIAQRISEEVIVEEFIEGEDHRFLVINYQLVAVARRSPASVTGDGLSTIKQLIDFANADPQRGNGEEHVLSPIKVDEVTQKILSEHNLTLETILPAAQQLILKDTANISAGGTATDLTDVVHPENKFLAERIARLFNLDICGVDIMTTSVEIPITRETGAVIEVNAGPGIRMHSNPQSGKERNVAAPIIDMLFPEGSKTTIPIIAVAESQLGSLPVSLLTHVLNQSGFKAGCNTSEGIVLDGHKIKAGDATDYKSLQDVLFDTSIDIAVLECTDQELVQSGLGFETCDLAIIPGVQRNAPFPEEVSNFEDLIKLKSTLAAITKPEGWCILNADDKRIDRIQKDLHCKLAFYSLDSDSPLVLEYRKNGGVIAVLENDMLLVYKGDLKISVCDIKSIDVSGEKKEETMSSLLIVALGATLLGTDIKNIGTILEDYFKSKVITSKSLL